jgi:hypothetical protein
VEVCPNYLDYELAVLQSNISACHLKLEQWKEAIASATKAIDGLDRVDKEAALEEEQRKLRKEKEKLDDQKATEEKEDEVEEEIVSSGASKAAPAPPPEPQDAESLARQKRADDVLRIRAKALMRRARARSEQGGWQNLSGAEEDYKLLSQMKNLSQADRRIVLAQLAVLPPRTKAAQETETAEMWGKLKEVRGTDFHRRSDMLTLLNLQIQLGNGILKPFGLSTDNFQMVKDENTGGYSVNFNQGR